MSTENTPVETDDVNLDDFAAELFGQSKPAPEPASSEDEEVTEEVPDAQEEETQVTEDDTLDEDSDNDEAEDAEEEETPVEDVAKPKKNRFQERIDKAVGAQREAERKLAAALAELETAKKTPEPAPTASVPEDNEPTPADLNEDGTEKYPLGEFDPLYFKDLMRHTLAKETKAREEQMKNEATQREQEATQAALEASWAAKVAPAQERYPDFIEKGRNLIDTFEGIDAAYGEYLTATLMDMEHGPDVLYYLANNTDEASKIVNSGPQRATVALGRLEAKFADAAEEKQRARPKVSKAPEPAPMNKGSSVAVNEVPDDTDDLDAFSKKLFKKK